MKKIVFILLSVGLIFVMGLLAIYGVLSLPKPSENVEVVVEEVVKPLTAEQKAIVELMEGFEVSFNDFLGEVRGEVIVYRQQRKLLDEMITPLNLRSADYVDETYKFASVLIPSLKLKMDDVIDIFAQKDEEVRQLLEGQNEDLRRGVLKRWNDMKAEQGEKFVTYFAFEGDILDAYEAFLRFYYARQNFVRFDEKQEVVFFDAAEDNVQVDVLRAAIDALKTEQRQALAALKK